MIVICLGSLPRHAAAQGGGELRFCLRSEPKTFDPLKVEDDAPAAIRYLTGGVLVRVNRQTQELEPELAQSWKVSKDGRQITFQPAQRNFIFRWHAIFGCRCCLHGSAIDGPCAAFVDRRRVPLRHGECGNESDFPDSDLDHLSRHPWPDWIGFSIRSRFSPSIRRRKRWRCSAPSCWPIINRARRCCLKRNPNYWKTDEQGRKLPYLDSIRLDIQPNRDVEMLRFKRGELDLINSLDSEYFDKLAATSPQLVHDAGPSLDSEQLWFNEVAKSPIPAYKKNWFRSANFRRAISEAINRDDLSRIVFHGHAQPAAWTILPGE